MFQFLSRPDPYIARVGRLDAVATSHAIQGAPAFMRGLRAVFVSDTHVLPRASRADIDALVQRIADARADLLLLGGDYSDSEADAARLFEALRAVVPPMGGYGVLGNNDSEAWRDRLDALRAVMARAGCRLLVNESLCLERGGGRLWIGGVDEHLYGAPSADGLYPPGGGDAYRVLLSHYPVMPSLRPDLMLCGHTHGGQFNFLGLTPFSIGFERVKKPYRAAMAVAGLHEIEGVRLLVSKGIGASRIQLRVCVRPEINVLDFV